MTRRISRLGPFLLLFLSIVLLVVAVAAYHLADQQTTADEANRLLRLSVWTGIGAMISGVVTALFCSLQCACLRR